MVEEKVVEKGKERAVEVTKWRRVFDDYRAMSDEILRPDEPKKEKFLEAMRKYLTKQNWPFLLPYKLTLEACTKCGTCAEACTMYLGSGRKKIYSPVYRSDMLRKIYKKHFTLTGKLFGPLIGAKDPTEDDINALAESAYRCTVCRRCALACPFGLDNGLITRETRKIFADLGIVPDELKDNGVENQLKYGNAPKIPYEAFMDILEFIKEDIEDEKGVEVEIPVDKKGAKYLIMNNAGDYLAFTETVQGIVEIMNYVGEDWTLNSPKTGVNDIVNYGLFYSDEDLVRVMKAHVETAKKLDVEYLVVGECGHAYDSIAHFAKDLIPPEERPFKVISWMELLDQFIREGKLKLDKEKNPEPVTFHDSCKWGRTGGIYEEPRRILQAACKDFREMYPNREWNYCCGGGGGFAIMAKDDFLKFRMETYGKMKVQQLKQTGAKIIATICSNCKAQFREMINYYNLDMRFSGVSELVANALVYE
ncbi:(Fe-S)-binding protein [Archaeoglobus fulgidus]|jgi:Fe-S oxidoreductase|uniref:Reductase, iron-sulfur binding subunit n=2 Tax=Archaeoglobus fulgidus TaxID=2234 RepID=O29704_ARCFU|nr:(Fe-S)-binding protein [Archaeoglobus fulgidus]AAB90686.1 reductase, iron-sulfur binding subunit [Archaeoglobus fulgidus DSM 4304]KUJ92548.1 MAG: Reductase, iron-sulfur binding subunit [Archaeoglobus fulgidus]KUK05649.1 MAG: Reductase, iron-sulfur binding subunit [Archaeoglobus fulgidus]